MAGAGNQYPINIFSKGTFTRCVLAGTYPCRVDTGGDVAFYNCTLYRVAALTLQVRNSPVRTKLRNCIVMSSGTQVLDFQSITGEEDLDYNLYYVAGADPVTGTPYKWNGTGYSWANWKIQSSQDANSPTPADPLFTNLATNDFSLQAGSPAVNAGVVIAGVTDGYLGTAPDCGAYEKA
jgi:hypothetical protein